ncbi:MAG: relaxase/mobilization nuclease domain-containing protein [Schaalia hyovaginalis]|uniref:relaxase/mobilization nuclease domain-containing protein n=1 Tax=Schaalia hyovaginalis TaxID=29316 RepID=UPI002A750B4E|nr:relaxase/mobilization nuclease domain-containing protein [Schaalia hyovaginalis]MDY3093976.1 relaxase/mobilization nuclease domain-containing protein [Schaalia hyovaginalis]
MSTITVKSSKSAASAVNYVLYGSDARVRSLLVKEGRTRAADLAVHTADGPSTPEHFLTRAQALTKLHGRKVQAYTYVLAFHPDEFDVSDPAAMQRVCEVAKRLTEAMHSADYLIAVHTDAKGQHAHAHITVTNHDNLTGKALTRYTSWRHGLRQLNDQIMREEGLAVLPDPQRPKPEWLQRREDFSAGGFEQRLGDIVNDALHDPRSVDRESFEALLAEQDVRLTVTDRDGWSFKMRRTDNGKWGRKKASALCPDFTSEKASTVFEAHAKQTQQSTPTPGIPLMEEDEEEEKPIKRAPGKVAPPRGTTAAERWADRLPEIIEEDDDMDLSL